MLMLNVACHDHHTMDVTSNHLDIVPHGKQGTWGSPDDTQDQDAGEELSKRGERFGQPVGKGVFNLKILLLRIEIAIKR
jgi:DNA-directed RNA polymerase II subunit RPB3